MIPCMKCHGGEDTGADGCMNINDTMHEMPWWRRYRSWWVWGSNPSLLTSEAEWKTLKKLNKVGWPDEELVESADCPLNLCPGEFERCWGLEDLVPLPGIDLKRICCWDLLWRGEVPRILTDLEPGYVLVSIHLLVPLSDGSTLKNVKILLKCIWQDSVIGSEYPLMKCRLTIVTMHQTNYPKLVKIIACL